MVLSLLFLTAISVVNKKGRIGGEIVNNLSYANDLCLICLLSAGMQILLNVCSNYMQLSMAYHIMQTCRIHCAKKLQQ